MSGVDSDNEDDSKAVSIENILAKFFLEKMGDKSDDSSEYKRKKHKKHKSKKSKHKKRSRTNSSERASKEFMKSRDGYSSSEEKDIQRLKKLKKLDSKNKLNMPGLSLNIASNSKQNENTDSNVSSVPSISEDILYGPSLETLMSGASFSNLKEESNCKQSNSNLDTSTVASSENVGIIIENDSKIIENKIENSQNVPSISANTDVSNVNKNSTQNPKEERNETKNDQKVKSESETSDKHPLSKSKNVSESKPDSKTISNAGKSEQKHKEDRNHKRSRSRSKSLSNSKKSTKNKSDRGRSRTRSSSRHKSHKSKKSRSRSISRGRKRSRSRDKQSRTRSSSRHKSCKSKKSHSRSISRGRKRSRSHDKQSKRHSRKRSSSSSRKSRDNSQKHRSTSRKRQRSISRSHRSRSRRRTSVSRKSKSRSKSTSRRGHRSVSRHRKSRSRSRSRRRKSRSRSRSRHRKSRSRSRSRRGKSRSRSRSRRQKSRSRSRSRQRSRKEGRSRSRSRDKERSRSHRIDQEKIRQIAQKNVLTMIENGTLPEGLSLENFKKEQLVSLKAGGKSVQELTDFCAELSKKENDPPGEENKADGKNDTGGDSAFIHHPFKIKEASTIKLNIKNAVQIPIKTHAEKFAETAKLSSQFPVSSGNQHRQKELEWVPVETPTKIATVTNDVKAVVPLGLPSKPTPVLPQQQPKETAPIIVKPEPPAAIIPDSIPLPPPEIPVQPLPPPPLPPTLPSLPPACEPPPPPPFNMVEQQFAQVPIDYPINYTNNFSGSSTYGFPMPPEMNNFLASPSQPNTVNQTSVFPADSKPRKPIDVASVVSRRFKALTKLQSDPNDPEAIQELHQAQSSIQDWVQSQQVPGLFTGSTGAKPLSVEELSGPRHWNYRAKKDLFIKAAPVTEGKGMSLLKKMGWNPGEGLGKNKEGSLEPLVLDIKTDKKGLVSEGEGNKKLVSTVLKDLQGKHPVSALMELCSKRKWAPPLYTLVKESGPPHKKLFLFKVEVNGVEYMTPTPVNNKKVAKADAAVICLQSLNVFPQT